MTNISIDETERIYSRALRNSRLIKLVYTKKPSEMLALINAEITDNDMKEVLIALCFLLYRDLKGG